MKRLTTVALLLSLVLPTRAPAPCEAAKTLRIALVLWRGETDGERGFTQRAVIVE